MKEDYTPGISTVGLQKRKRKLFSGRGHIVMITLYSSRNYSLWMLPYAAKAIVGNESMNQGVTSNTHLQFVTIITLANEFIPRAMNFQVAPASALGMVASTQVWHRFLAFLVYIHITGWNKQEKCTLVTPKVVQSDV